MAKPKFVREPNWKYSNAGLGKGPGDPALKFSTRRKILFGTRNTARIRNSARKTRPFAEPCFNVSDKKIGGQKESKFLPVFKL